jgi:hypothetical protein
LARFCLAKDAKLGCLPTTLPGLASEGQQRVALRLIDAVPGQQPLQLRRTDASLASLDTAYLGPVAVEDPGGVAERAAGLFTETQYVTDLRLLYRRRSGPCGLSRWLGHDRHFFHDFGLKVNRFPRPG